MVAYLPCIYCGYLNNEKTIVCERCGKKIGEERKIISVKRRRKRLNQLLTSLNF